MVHVVTLNFGRTDVHHIIEIDNYDIVIVGNNLKKIKIEVKRQTKEWRHFWRFDDDMDKVWNDVIGNMKSYSFETREDSYDKYYSFLYIHYEKCRSFNIELKVEKYFSLTDHPVYQKYMLLDNDTQRKFRVTKCAKCDI